MRQGKALEYCDSLKVNQTATSKQQNNQMNIAKISNNSGNGSMRQGKALEFYNRIKVNQLSDSKQQNNQMTVAKVADNSKVGGRERGEEGPAKGVDRCADFKSGSKTQANASLGKVALGGNTSTLGGKAYGKGQGHVTGSNSHGAAIAGVSGGHAATGGAAGHGGHGTGGVSGGHGGHGTGGVSGGNGGHGTGGNSGGHGGHGTGGLGGHGGHGH